MARGSVLSEEGPFRPHFGRGMGRLSEEGPFRPHFESGNGGALRGGAVSARDMGRLSEEGPFRPHCGPRFMRGGITTSSGFFGMPILRRLLRATRAIGHINGHPVRLQQKLTLPHLVVTLGRSFRDDYSEPRGGSVCRIRKQFGHLFRNTCLGPPSGSCGSSQEPQHPLCIVAWLGWR